VEGTEAKIIAIVGLGFAIVVVVGGSCTVAEDGFGVASVDVREIGVDAFCLDK
jgi:hypothetical protein